MIGYKRLFPFLYTYSFPLATISIFLVFLSFTFSITNSGVSCPYLFDLTHHVSQVGKMITRKY